MRNFFVKSSQKKNTQLNKEVYEELKQFYCSFFSNTYNELNIQRYKKIRDAIGLVMQKYISQDNPLAYTGKLVMYIQGNIAMYRLHLSDEQRKLLRSIAAKTKKINLDFVYSGPITDVRQFFNT